LVLFCGHPGQVSIGRVWFSASSSTRLTGCRERLFGCLSLPLSQAPLVQKCPLSEALEKRWNWLFLAGLARSMLLRARAHGDSGYREMAQTWLGYLPLPRHSPLIPFSCSHSFGSSLVAPSRFRWYVLHIHLLFSTSLFIDSWSDDPFSLSLSLSRCVDLSPFEASNFSPFSLLI